jgi:hypothetical protein
LTKEGPGRKPKTEGMIKAVKPVIFDKSRLDELLELYPKKSMSEIIRDLVEKELERKNQIGPRNPIKVSYEQHNKVMSLLHYLQGAIDVKKSIDEECSTINDQKTLSRLKAAAYTINQSADRQSMLLYNRGIKS